MPHQHPNNPAHWDDGFNRGRPAWRNPQQYIRPGPGGLRNPHNLAVLNARPQDDLQARIYRWDDGFDYGRPGWGNVNRRGRRGEGEIGGRFRHGYGGSGWLW